MYDNFLCKKSDQGWSLNDFNYLVFCGYRKLIYNLETFDKTSKTEEFRGKNGMEKRRGKRKEPREIGEKNRPYDRQKSLQKQGRILKKCQEGGGIFMSGHTIYPYAAIQFSLAT